MSNLSALRAVLAASNTTITVGVSGNDIASPDVKLRVFMPIPGKMARAQVGHGTRLVDPAAPVEAPKQAGK